MLATRSSRVHSGHVGWAKAPQRPSVPPRMRLVVAAGSMLAREGLANLLEAAEFDVVGRATDAEDLLRKAGAHRPDVVVVDVSASSGLGKDGLRTARAVRLRWPAIGIVALADELEQSLAMELFADGTDGLGYVIKSCIDDLGLFAGAIRRVGNNGSSIDPTVVSGLLRRTKASDGIECLTSREAEVLSLVAAGHSNQGIAARLFLSERGVEKHMSNVYSKLDIAKEQSRHQRVLAALAYVTSSSRSRG